MNRRPKPFSTGEPTALGAFFQRVFDVLEQQGGAKSEQRGAFVQYMEATPPYARCSIPLKGLLGVNATFHRGVVGGLYISLPDAQETPARRDKQREMGKALRPMHQEWLELIGNA
jgi:hypothetical protein